MAGQLLHVHGTLGRVENIAREHRRYNDYSGPLKTPTSAHSYSGSQAQILAIRHDKMSERSPPNNYILGAHGFAYSSAWRIMNFERMSHDIRL